MTNIVMLVRDRFRLTEQALRTLTNNTPQDQCTLTIVNDSSEDFRVQRLLHSNSQLWRNRTLITIDKSAHVLARAKNLGVFWSRQTFGQGDWLYLSDCDVCFLPGWLEKLTTTAAAAEKANFKLMGGQIHPFHGTNDTAEIVQSCGWAEHLVLDGPSWLMRWQTWKEVGQFSKTCAPGPCQSEDAEWCARLVAKGGRIGVIHPHVVVHTGLTQTDGKDAPGRAERERMIPPGVLAE